MSDFLWYIVLGFGSIGVILLSLTWPWIVEWYVGGPWKLSFK